MPPARNAADVANKSQYEGLVVLRNLMTQVRPVTAKQVAVSAFHDDSRAREVAVSRTLNTLEIFGWVNKSGSLYGLSEGYIRDIAGYRHGILTLVRDGLTNLNHELDLVRQLDGGRN